MFSCQNSESETGKVNTLPAKTPLKRVNSPALIMCNMYLCRERERDLLRLDLDLDLERECLRLLSFLPEKLIGASSTLVLLKRGE